MRRRHPDLPGAVRPFYRGLKAFAIVGATVAAVSVFWLAQQGAWDYALWLFALTMPLAALPWLHPMSPSFAAVLAFGGLFMGVVARAWLYAALLCGLAAWSFWTMGRPVGAGIKMTLHELAPGAVMKGAQAPIEAFESLGFHQVGAYGARYRGVDITVSLLLSPDGGSYASVTDVLWNVTSLFPDSRRLLTRNSHHGILAPSVLVNPAPGASPDKLVASHGRALQALAAQGQMPLQVSGEDLVRLAIDIETGTLEWARTGGRASWRRERPIPLWDRSDLADRISAWGEAG
jgi:hypothetical protein